MGRRAFVALDLKQYPCDVLFDIDIVASPPSIICHLLGNGRRCCILKKSQFQQHCDITYKVDNLPSCQVRLTNTNIELIT